MHELSITSAREANINKNSNPKLQANETHSSIFSNKEDKVFYLDQLYMQIVWLDGV